MLSRFTPIRRHFLCIVLTLILVPVPAFAGPPLICDPFHPAAGATLLPWDDEGVGWNTPDPQYDRRRLVGDVLRLLTAEAPILARMENLRRATIYAASDERRAGELLAAVTARTRSAASDPMSWFDAGYLIETYRQAAHIGRWDMLPEGKRGVWSMNRAPDADGYAMVKKAQTMLSTSNPAIEFAASLMTTGAISEAHRQRAIAGAARGSDLERHLRK